MPVVSSFVSDNNVCNSENSVVDSAMNVADFAMNVGKSANSAVDSKTVM